MMPTQSTACAISEPAAQSVASDDVKAARKPTESSPVRLEELVLPVESGAQATCRN